MGPTPSKPSRHGRILLATVLLINLVAVAGCSTTDDYVTDVGEPTTGTVIGSFSITDINELDGAQYELEHRLNASEKSPYTVKVYAQTDNGTDIQYVTDLDSNESIYRNTVAPPWDASETRRYELRIVNRTDDTIVDTINFTITNGSE